MIRRFGSVFVAIVLGLTLFTSVFAQDPVKWSAPRQHYPSQWNSTPAPQNNYANQYYGYQDPNAYWYGYGGYQNQNWGPPQPGGFSGNPYYYYGY